MRDDRSSFTRLFSILFTALVVASLTPVYSQQAPTQPPRRASGVVGASATAILVDVVVRDKQGQPVSDLTASDFELFEDGVRQDVGSLRQYAAEAPVVEKIAVPAAAASPPPAEARPRVEAAPPPVVALVFDRLSPEARALAVKAANSYIGSREQTEALVGAFGIDQTLTTFQSYTHDAALLRKAVEAMGVRSTNTFNSDFAKRANEAGERAASNAAVAQNSTSAGGPAAAAGAAAAGGAGANAVMAQMEQHMLETFDALERDQSGYASVNSLLALVNSMRTLPGRKSVVFFSEGVVLPPNVVEQFRAVIDSANRANVSIYTMDAAGLRTESTSKEARDNIMAAAGLNLRRNPTADVVGAPMTQALERNEDLIRMDPHSGLNQLANDTGAVLIRNSNDLNYGLRRVDEDMRHYYVLTYVPKNDVFDGKFRKIAVNVKRGGVQVAARKGYYALRSQGSEPVMTFEAPALAMLDSTPVPNAFPVRAAALRFPDPVRPGLAPVLVTLRASELTFQQVPEKHAYTADFVVIVRFRNQANEIVQKLSQHYELNAPAERIDSVKAGDVLFYRQPQLSPGIYTMETVVYDALANRASVRFSSVEQPKPGDGALQVSSLVVVGRGERVATADRSDDNPFLVGDMLLYPNLGDTLSKSQAKELGFFFTVYTKSGDVPDAVLELMQNGQLKARIPITLDKPGTGGRIQEVGRVPLEAVPAGTYDLRVIVGQKPEQQVRSVLVKISD